VANGESANTGGERSVDLAEMRRWAQFRQNLKSLPNNNN
jgi:hypothetical protein